MGFPSFISITIHRPTDCADRQGGAEGGLFLIQNTISYCSLFRYHDSIVQATAGPSITTRFCAGAAAGATATTLTYPLDLVRARLAAHWSLQPRYSGLTGGIREIVETEGVMALYAGIRPTL